MEPRSDTIPHLFLSRVAQDPDAVALRQKKFGLWEDITWAGYAALARSVGNGLLALGFEPGQSVSMIGENSPEWLFADLGIQSVGGVTVGIYTTNSAEECRYVLENSGTRYYIVENEEQLDKALQVRDELPDLEKIIVIDLEGLRHFKDPMVISWDEFLELGRAYGEKNPDHFGQRLEALNPDDVALLIYTSGTTGPPKGAMLTHANIVWTTQSAVVPFEVTEKDEVISFLPMSHIAERMLSIYVAMRAGYRVNFVENTDTVTQNMTEISPTFMLSVPRIWEKYHSFILIRMKDATWFKRVCFGSALKIGKRYAEARLNTTEPIPLSLRLLFALADRAVFRKLKERLGFERLKVAVSAAAPISPDILRFYHSIGVPLRQLYGQTEDCGPATCHRGDLIDPTNTGPPLPGVEVRIAPDGEILVRAPSVFKGYWRNPEATAETIVDGWLHSGDVGEIDERGFIKITDRKKDLIITSGGKNIAPQNIENQLKFSPYVNDAVVIGDARKYLTALIIIDEDNVVKYAQDHKIQYTTYASLTRAEEIQKLIAKEVLEVNKTLARVETIKKFCILPKKLLEEDGEVTPTMKVKRKYINESFGALIEGMYRGREGISV